MIDIFDFDKPGSAFSQSIDRLEKDLRRPFTEFIEKLGLDRHSLDWWVSNLASRNVFTSPLYFLCCRLALLAELVENGPGIRLIRTSDPCAGEVIRNYLRSNGKEVRLEVSAGRTATGIRREIVRFSKFFLFLRNSVLTFFRRAVAARSTRRRGKKVPAEITLLDTYVSESCFTTDGYTDRYYPGILKYLSEEERDGIYFVFTADSVLSYKTLYQNARDSDVNFLIKEDYLSIFDYLYALFYPLRYSRFKFRDTTLGPYDLGPVIKKLSEDDKYSLISLEGLLNDRMMCGIKRTGVKIRMMIDWFENQWMDKGLHSGFHKYFPEGSSIGYQGFLFSKVHLSIYPATAELEAGVVPRTVGVAGPGFLEERKEFCPGLKTVTVPTLRYAYIHEMPVRTAESTEPFVILVGLSQILDVSKEILQALLEISSRLMSFKVRIKPHPTMPGTVQTLVPVLPSNFRFVEGSFQSQLSHCHLLLGSESSTAMEALAAGVPVIDYTGGSAPSKTVVPEDIIPEMYRLCYTPEELLAAVLFFQNTWISCLPVRKAQAYRIRALYFTPVTRASVRTMLGLNN